MNKLTSYFFEASINIFTQAEVATAISGTAYSQYGLIKRAMASGEILNIRRGLYCLAPKYQKTPISSYSLAEHIYGPSYISTETALSFHGWIPEAVCACTCSSYNAAKEFTTPLGIFSYKPVPQRTFYFDVERQKDENGNVFFMATPAKALADYVYIHRLRWNGIADAAMSLRIDEEDLGTVKPQELSELLDNYKNGRIIRFLSGWLGALKS